MLDDDWRQFLKSCRNVLGQGDWDPFLSESWCAFTTFASIKNGIHYWSCGFPDDSELLDSETIDGGLWRQSFKYNDIAHLVVPATFYWEAFVDDEFKCGIKKQNIDLLSSELNRIGIMHRKTELILEIKLY